MAFVTTFFSSSILCAFNGDIPNERTNDRPKNDFYKMAFQATEERWGEILNLLGLFIRDEIYRNFFCLCRRLTLIVNGVRWSIETNKLRIAGAGQYRCLWTTILRSQQLKNKNCKFHSNEISDAISLVKQNQNARDWNLSTSQRKKKAASACSLSRFDEQSKVLRRITQWKLRVIKLWWIFFCCSPRVWLVRSSLSLE